MKKVKYLNSLKKGLGSMLAFSTHLLGKVAYKQYTSSGLIEYGNSDVILSLTYQSSSVNKNDNN